MFILRALGTNLIFIISIIADATAVFFLLRPPEWDFAKENPVWYVYYSNIVIAGIALILLLRLSYVQQKWRRKKRYALAFKIINQGFAELHEFERQKKHTKETKIYVMEKFCDAIAATFKHVTASQCSVCIKALERNGERLEVHTLARDTSSKNSRPLQKKDSDNNLHHWVESNTDFNHILQNLDNVEKRYFCSNNLLWHNDYKNSRISEGNKTTSNYFFLNQFNKVMTWSLPYKCSLVVPIIPGNFNSENTTLAGFLCIDSPDVNRFKIDYDLPIAQGLADGLYNIMVKYYNS